MPLLDAGAPARWKARQLSWANALCGAQMYCVAAENPCHGIDQMGNLATGETVHVEDEDPIPIMTSSPRFSSQRQQFQHCMSGIGLSNVLCCIKKVNHSGGSEVPPGLVTVLSVFEEPSEESCVEEPSGESRDDFRFVFIGIVVGATTIKILLVRSLHLRHLLSERSP